MLKSKSNFTLFLVIWVESWWLRRRRLSKQCFEILILQLATEQLPTIEARSRIRTSCSLYLSTHSNLRWINCGCIWLETEKISGQGIPKDNSVRIRIVRGAPSQQCSIWREERARLIIITLRSVFSQSSVTLVDNELRHTPTYPSIGTQTMKQTRRCSTVRDSEKVR